MPIHTRDSVAAAYQRALALHPDHDAAVDATAQALALPREAVLDCVEKVAA